MIDKTGNSDTHSKLLSGSGSLEMKSDGLSLGLSACERGHGFRSRETSSSLVWTGDDNMPHA